MFIKNKHLRKKTCPITILLFILIFMSGCYMNGDGESYYKEGMKYFHQQQYEEASLQLEKATISNPDKAEYYIAYGMCLIELSRFEESINVFDKAILDKKNQIVYENNKQAFRGKGICYFYSKNFKESLAWFDKALEIKELSNLNMDILQYKGQAQCRLNDFEGAIKTYSEIIDNSEYKSSFYLQRAYAFSQIEDIENALKDYDFVISKSKEEYEAYVGAYQLLASNGRKADGDKYLDQALSLNVNDEEHAIDIAKLQYYKGNTDVAIDGLIEAAKNGNKEADFYLGKLYEEEKKYQEAIPYLLKFIENDVDTTRPEAYNLLGMCYYKLEEYDKALQQFELGIETNDSSYMQTLMKNEVIAYEHLGDYQTAYENGKNYVSLYKEDVDMQKELEFIKTRLISVSK